MSDSSAGAVSRFERDLREIRESRGITLEQVQKRTRIPLDVLERLEQGQLIRDPQFNEVYLKALIRSYAESIDLSGSEVLEVYETHKLGLYRGKLRTHLGEEVAPEPEPEPEEVAPEEMVTESGPPAVAALRSPSRVDEAESPIVEKKPKPKSRSSFARPNVMDKSWGVIIGVTILGVLIIGGLLWLLLREEPLVVEQTAQQVTTQAPDTEESVEVRPVSTAPQLSLPITVTLTASGGSLQGFRVTEVPDVRRPYWIEPDSSMTFRSDSLLIFWGTGTGEVFRIPSGVELELQGYRWQPREGTVLRIDRNRARALLDSLHVAG